MLTFTDIDSKKCLKLLKIVQIKPQKMSSASQTVWKEKDKKIKRLNSIQWKLTAHELCGGRVWWWIEMSTSGSLVWYFHHGQRRRPWQSGCWKPAVFMLWEFRNVQPSWRIVRRLLSKVTCRKRESSDGTVEEFRRPTCSRSLARSQPWVFQHQCRCNITSELIK